MYLELNHLVIEMKVTKSINLLITKDKQSFIFVRVINLLIGLTDISIIIFIVNVKLRLSS